MTLRLRELDYGAVPWDVLNSCKDRTLLQTKAWLEYLAETQHATPVVAAVEQGTQVLGYVRGLVIRRFGLRILGSPFPGWTTSHMAFNVEGDVAEVDLLAASRGRALRNDGQRVSAEDTTGGKERCGPNGKCIATAIYAGMNQLVEFWGNASFRADQHLRPNEALRWYAMRYCKHRGLRKN